MNNPGRLDRQITLLQRTLTRDTSGSAVESWQGVALLWAEVKETTAREFFASQQKTSEVSRVFIIRYRDGIDSHSHRVLYRGESHDIDSVVEIGRREGLELRATHRRTGT
jgi:SPP1 family predicted phage head-tail adaptor